MTLHQIIYISSATPELTEESLLELLSSSRERNAKRNITGLLLHSDGSIIQIIEGPENAVQALYEKISRDPRHRGVTLISSKAIAKRDFPNYRMGFKRSLNKEFEEQIPGYTDIVENRSVTEEEIAGLSKLVASFIRTFAKTTRIDQFEH